MKCILILATVCAVAFAQGEHGDPAARLVRDQVHALLQATPTLSVADCTAKCDAVFALDVPREEELTDQDCARECQRQIHGEPTGPPRASHGP